MMQEHYNLASLFYNIVKLNGSNSALAFKNATLTYNELNKLSNQIANYFLSIGIKQNNVIAVFNTKDPLGYASMLACLKIGAVYTNIDEENPPHRLQKILQVCNPKLLVSDHKPSDTIYNVANESGIELIDFKSDCTYLEKDDKDLEISHNITGSNPAYIMFTSGSTGLPKGVLISHDNILSFLKWSIERFEVTSKDRFVQVSPIYFDNSVFDFYTALFSGASLTPISKEVSKSPVELINLVDKLKCTIWFSVPSLLVYLLAMRVLTKNTLQNIRIFTFGGEGFPKGELKKLYDLYSHKSKLINVYGPTEGTCICSSYEISKDDFKDMSTLAPLGTINPNFEYWIVDENMKKTSKGEKGELCLTGDGVALGYYNNVEQTRKSFVQNNSAITYKTGDIVYEKDNLLWFVGRIDNQIKHMGYRIELEEIESALNGLKYINQSAVIYKRIKTNYGKIIAFVTSEDTADESTIKNDLSDFLPHYMIPNIIEIRDKLPKNANGKVDKKNL